MDDIILVGILILLFLGIGFYFIKQKGKKGCCGSGNYKPKKKKLPCVIATKTFSVGGMHCDHCKNRVEEAVNDVNGVAGKVDLKKGTVTVSYAQAVDDALIIQRIEKAGYTVTK